MIPIDCSLIYFHSILYLFDVTNICNSLYNFGQTWDALTLKKVRITYIWKGEYYIVRGAEAILLKSDWALICSKEKGHIDTDD